VAPSPPSAAVQVEAGSESDAAPPGSAGTVKIEEFERERAAVRAKQQAGIDQAAGEFELAERERRARAAEDRLAYLDEKAEAYHMKPPGKGRKLGDSDGGEPPAPPKPIPPAKKTATTGSGGSSSSSSSRGGGGYNPMNPGATRSTFRSSRNCGPRG